MTSLLWSLKQIRMRLFESCLMVLAIGLGAGALCSVAALLLTFDDMTGRQLREAQLITIMPAERDRSGLWSLSSDASPVKLLGRVDDEDIVLTVNDVESLKAEVPSVKYAFTTRSQRLLLTGAAPEPVVDHRTAEGQLRWDEWYTSNSIMAHFTFIDAMEAEGLDLESGSFFIQSDFSEGRPVAVIGKNVAQRLFDGSDPIGKSIELRVDNSPTSVPVPITVVGVLKELKTEGTDSYLYSSMFSTRVSSLNDGIFLPFTAVDTLYRNAGRTYSGSTHIDRILVVPDDDVELGTALARIRTYVSSRYGLGLSVTSPLESITGMREATSMMMIVIGAFGSVALVIAAVNALNLMIARVLRRTKSFGISASLGLSRRGIFAQFMTECFVLSLLGALIGIGIAAVFARLFSTVIARGEIAIPISIEVWLIGLGVAVLATLVFGLYPALQASRTNVVDALRTE